MNFNEKVLNLTKKIPKGKITTYKVIAKKLGINVYRAVGTALRNNEKPIIIPCHRVVNSSGKVGAYAGVKDSRKKIRLLRKEGINIKNNKVDLNRYLFKF